MIKKLLLVVLILSANLSYAGDDVDLIRDVASDGLIRVKNIRGEVRIIGWNKNKVSIVGELDDLAEGLVFEVDSDRTTIEVLMPRKNVNWGDGSDLEIRVPRQSRVSFVGVSTDLEVEDIQGGLKLKSISGDITAENVNNRMMVSSISGDVVVKRSAGDLHASSVSGSLDVRSHVGEVDLESVSGGIELKVSGCEKMRVQGISGDIDVKTELIGDARIEIQSVSGNIDLKLVGNVDARFRLEAGMGGRIENDLSELEATRSFIGQESLKMTLGKGSARVVIHTVSADIRIE